jgi:hypothetical protein
MKPSGYYMLDEGRDDAERFDAVIEDLMSAKVIPDAPFDLEHDGVPVDANWPPEALVALVRHWVVKAKRHSDAHLNALDMLKAATRSRKAAPLNGDAP